LAEDKWRQVRQRLEAEADETVTEIHRLQEMLRSRIRRREIQTCMSARRRWPFWTTWKRNSTPYPGL